jgi:hypothetical protein
MQLGPVFIGTDLPGRSQVHGDISALGESTWVAGKGRKGGKGWEVGEEKEKEKEQENTIFVSCLGATT